MVNFIKNGVCFYGNTHHAQKVVSSFKEVKSKIYNMDGGVGKLQTAVDLIDERIKKEDEVKEEKIKTAGQRLAAFMNTAKQTDIKVAKMVASNQQKFFEANPWAIPPAPPKKKSLWQRIKDGFKKIGKAIKKAATWVVDTAKKVWKKTKEFCKKHWKAIVKIVVGVVVIAGLAALSVFTGGAAAPLFAVAAKGAAICACTSAAVSVVSGVAQGKSFGEIFDSSADSFMIGAVTGAATGFAGAAASSVASATGSQLLGEVTKIGVETAGKFLAKGASYLIDKGSLKGFMKQEGMGILKDAGMSCLSAAGGYLKSAGKDLLGKAFGGLKESQLVNSFKKAYQFCADKAPTLTKIVTSSVKDTFSGMSVGDLVKLKNPAEFAKGIGKSFLGNLASNAAGSAGDLMKNEINDLTNGAVDKVTNFAGEVISDLKNSDFGKAVSNTYDNIKGVVNTISGEFKGIQGVYKDVIGNISGTISSAGNAFGDTFSKITNSITSGSSLLGSAAKGIGGNLGQIINSAIGDYSKVAIPSVNNLSQALSQVFKPISGALNSFASGATTAANTASSLAGAIDKFASSPGSCIAGFVGAKIAPSAPSLIRATNPTLGFLSKIRL